MEETEHSHRAELDSDRAEQGSERAEQGIERAEPDRNRVGQGKQHISSLVFILYKRGHMITANRSHLQSASDSTGGVTRAWPREEQGKTTILRKIALYLLPFNNPHTTAV